MSREANGPAENDRRHCTTSSGGDAMGHRSGRTANALEVLEMAGDSSTSILDRLLVVTLASRDAFADAARAADTPRAAAALVQRAEHQARLALQLRDLLLAGGAATQPAEPTSAVSGRGAPRRLPSAGGGDARGVLDECMRVLDTARMEFCRAYGPSVALTLSNAMPAERVVNPNDGTWR